MENTSADVQPRWKRSRVESSRVESSERASREKEEEWGECERERARDAKNGVRSRERRRGSESKDGWTEKDGAIVGG